MTTLEVFAPLTCALPHEVAVGDDEAACRLTVDLQWLADQGVSVTHASLSDEPGRFVEHDAVRFLMTILGTDVLPVILVDGLIRSHGRYPDRRELAGWAGLDAEVDANGTLTGPVRVEALTEPVHVEAADEVATAAQLTDDGGLTAPDVPVVPDELPTATARRRGAPRRTLSTASRSRTAHVARRRAPGAA
jgi:arsenite-transporting ATPase